MTEWHLKHAIHGDKPWAVQAEALRRASGHAKYGYWLEQGLGKTGLTINDFVSQDDTDINVVIVPNSFKMDWVLAPAEWGVPWLESGMWPNNSVPSNQTYYQYAVNYEAARQGALRPLIELMERRNCMLTIDESTQIKNPQSSTFKAVLELSKRAKVVRELNGTPLTQNVMDYYGQLRVLGQFQGIKPVVYRNRYAEMGGYFNKEIKGTRNEEELAKIVESCTFRALKKDWRKDLPPQILKPVHLEMSNRQLAHYRSMMDEFFTVVDEEEITAELVLTQMDKLRQISSCVIMNAGEHHFIEDDNKNPKLRAVMDLLESSPGKVIVSYYYRPSGVLLQRALDKAGYKPAVIRGGMKPEQIIDNKNRFNQDPSCRVLIGQQEATGRGHTLLGGKGRDRCSTMIFYENSFSWYWRSQMQDRNHRGEQDTECNIYDLITSPMDALTVDVLTNKKDLASRMDDVIAAVRNSRHT